MEKTPCGDDHTVNLNQHSILKMVGPRRALVAGPESLIDESFFTIASAGFSKPVDADGSGAISAAEIAEDPEFHLRQMLEAPNVTYLYDPEMDDSLGKTVDAFTTLYLHMPFNKRSGFDLNNPRVLNGSGLASLKPEDRSVVIPFNIKLIQQSFSKWGEMSSCKAIVTPFHTGVNVPCVQFEGGKSGQITKVRMCNRVRPAPLDIDKSLMPGKSFDSLKEWLKSAGLDYKSE